MRTPSFIPYHPPGRLPEIPGHTDRGLRTGDRGGKRTEDRGRETVFRRRSPVAPTKVGVAQSVGGLLSPVANRDSFGADPRGHFHLRALITAHVRASDIQTELRYGASGHTHVRLAAIAGDPIGIHPLGRVVRAIIDSVDESPMIGQLSLELAVNLSELCFSNKTARHRRLVSDHSHLKTVSVQNRPG